MSWRIDKMAVGESQDWNWAARGWVRSLVFVFFSYASKAALRTDWKLEPEEEEALGWVWDMVLVESEKKLVDGRKREQCSLVFCPTDGWSITTSAESAENLRPTAGALVL
jgi:hypothetical protein